MRQPGNWPRHLTLADFLRSRGHLNRVGGVAFLAELDTAAPLAANVLEYARIVAEQSTRRRALAVLTPAVRTLSGGSGDTTDAIAAVQLGLLEVEEKRKPATFKPFSDTLQRTLDLLDTLRDHRGA